MTRRLAIVATHPIQYSAPWFRYLAQSAGLTLRVFYLWDLGVRERTDPGFQAAFRWDIPLLEGYESEFVPNRSPRPGTDRFTGLWNPDLPARVKRYAPDAVLLTAYNYASLAWFLLRWPRGGAPLLFRGDSHRLLPESGARATIRRAVIAKVLSRFAACLYVGAANRGYFEFHGVPDAKLFASPHAVDNERFFQAGDEAARQARQWRLSLAIPEDHRVVLFAGKFEEKKRPLDLLEAFQAAGLERASLLFVGSGPLEGALRERAATMRDVHFAPFQNQSLMPRTFAACDVFVLPSFGPAETWGLAVNEAMCMGRPVIVSDHVGCARDLVMPSRNGLVFRAGDVDALASCLREACSDAARLFAWGQESRRIIAGFTYRQASDGLLAALAAPGIGATTG